MAPCCWSESLAVHRSQLAAQLRNEIRGAVDAGRSDREILDAYISKYGLRILREPEGARRAWLNGVLVVALILGILVLVLVLRRLRPESPAQTPVYANAGKLPDEELW